MHLQNSQSGYEAGTFRLFDKPVNNFAVELLVIEFGERACIEKDGQCGLKPRVPLRPDVVGKVARYFRESPTNFFERRLRFV